MDDGAPKYALEIRLVEVGAVSTILEPDVLASLRAAPNEFMRAGAAFSLTDAAVPGLGTLSARVLFYEDRYAGNWSHGDVGGNQFGRIVRAGEEAQ